MFVYIILSTFMQDLPVGLALCIVPAIIGWLAAYTYYNVGSLKGQIAALTEESTSLKAKVDSLSAENTELRVKLTQAEAEIERLNGSLRKAKDDLMLCEGDRIALRSQLEEGGKASKAGTTITFAGAKYKWDDLKIVEGIGPKIAELLNDAGIKTWKELAAADPERLREILHAAGPNFQIHEPASWPEQAGLADNEAWDDLKKLQDNLKGGRE